MNFKAIVSLAVSLGIVLGAGAQAQASVSPTVDGTSWEVSDLSSFGFSRIGYGTAPYGAYGIDYFRLSVQNANANSWDSLTCGANTPTTEADGDYLIDCSSGTSNSVSGLTWTGSAKLFSGPYLGLVGRLEYTLTNPTGSAMTIDARLQVDNEECNNSVGNLTTSSGDQITTTADFWDICGNDNAATELSAWGNDFATSIVTSGTTSSSGNWQYVNSAVTLNPGASKTYVFFYYGVGSTTRSNANGITDDEAMVTASSYFDLCTIGDSRLWEGLSTVDNWDLAAASGCDDSETEALAETGVSDTVSAGTLAVGFLTLVAAVVLRRRRAQV